MKFYVGTSGYSYQEWKGNFYPENLPQKKMLNYYGQHFGAVEINYTFRTFPKVPLLESWTEQVPKGFQFVLKAPQAITHYKRLKSTAAIVNCLLKTTAVLQDRLGPILFQLPPTLQKDVTLLAAFLKRLRNRCRAAFEFRHPSWLDDEVFACLRAHSCAHCFADFDEELSTELVRTTNWGYVRLRKEKYTDRELKKWIAKLRSQKWKRAYVFFRHEDTGTGPKFGQRFLELAAK